MFIHAETPVPPHLRHEHYVTANIAERADTLLGCHRDVSDVTENISVKKKGDVT